MTPEAFRFCPNCGQEKNDHSPRCPRCGRSLSGFRDKRILGLDRSHPLTIIGAVGLLLAGLMLLYFFLARQLLGGFGTSLAGSDQLKVNMKQAQVLLYTYMAEDGRGFPVIRKGGGHDPDDQMAEHIVRELNRMRNPVRPGRPAWTVSFRDPPFWPLVEPGQLVYVQTKLHESRAGGFVIYARGRKRPLDLEMRQSAEERGQTESSPEEINPESGFEP